jgi:hypothetical protein
MPQTLRAPQEMTDSIARRRSLTVAALNHQSRDREGALGGVGIERALSTDNLSRSAVLHSLEFFAPLEDFGGPGVRKTKEISPAHKRWERCHGHQPRNGAKECLGALFSPSALRLRLCCFVLHLFKFFAGRQDSPPPWRRHSACRVDTHVDARLFDFWLRFCCFVGQPIQAADPLSSGSSRLKTGCGLNCPPHRGRKAKN